ncbi:GGDEF domain-containing protein [Luteibacter aegosomaticola]|uniref:tetratricopeptide repeat-containing diguanylate cyclase n=1 Tax=Luteibacter aegosomaticola TaxID=2911538 RepID=UPI001FFABD14|nr:GGDEF domain-containing protein [Luteibacter aegosomaticola]UPG91743.1 GGDEF domain-containing protein [Luteibacter aegosomaticola]
MALALGLCAPGLHADPALPAPAGGARLAQADALRTSDHGRFVVMLESLRNEAANLTEHDRWYLRFLDGWEANYEGRYPAAETTLRDVMAHADDDVLVTRATAMLMNNLSEQGKYAEAYAVATRAADGLPDVSDPLARYVLLANLSQMLTFAGQPEVGLDYAEKMLKATPAGQSPCQAMVQKVTALEGSRKLTSQSPELLSTIDACAAAGQPIFANTMSLILVDRLIDENKLPEALAASERITPVIEASHYYRHIIDAMSQRARIYDQLGNAAAAKKTALATVAMGHDGDINEALRFAFRILYTIEKAQGHPSSALDYYEHYVVQDQGYLRDANVRNAAYEAAREHFRADKLETEGLSKENRILRLQQALDGKAVETSRLYVVMMAIVLLSIIFLMIRIKRSQLRFKWLSSCDGLTGIFHHQHFMSEAGRGLRMLEKRSSDGCLVFVDLDHFKQVNDTHGHAVGDAVLKHAVAICKGQLRKADLLGRLGGEEFGILLVDTPMLQGRVVAERIRLAFASSPLEVDGVVVSFSASVGLASTAAVGHDLQALCRAADAALYVAKHRGRNRLVVHGDGDEPVAMALLAAGSRSHP